MQNKNIAVILARMGSTRLPGKVLKRISGKPMLEHLIDRLAPSKKLDSILIATTENSEDNKIEQFCNGIGIKCFRGDSNDVLKRLYDASKSEGATGVAPLMGDSPLMHYQLIDEIIEKYKISNKPYCSTYTKTIVDNEDSSNLGIFPIGIWAQFCSFSNIERAHLNAVNEYHRIHAMTYIFSQRNLFEPSYLYAQGKWSILDNSELCLAVNTSDQFDFVSSIFDLGLKDSKLFDLIRTMKIVNRHIN